MFPEHMPDRLDRLTMLAGVRVLSETRQRTASSVERLRYPIVRRVFPTGSVGPGAGGTLTVGVVLARWSNPNGVVQAGALTEGVHFEVTQDGSIDWTLGDTAEPRTSPPEGAWYSMRYYARPVFVVKGFPFIRRDTFVQDIGQPEQEFSYLPLLVHAAPEFLGHRDGDELTNEPPPNPDGYPYYGAP
jgi:hypothetical protein